MLALYRLLLSLYPAAFRGEFAEEMIAVVSEAETDLRATNPASRTAAFWMREVAGLLRGAALERLRFLFDSSLATRRFKMRSDYRFPRSATLLMFLILALVMVAIEKARSIAGSLPHTNPLLPPIHPVPLDFPVTFALMFGAAWAVAILTWAVLFILRRSGVHRLSDLSVAASEK